MATLGPWCHAPAAPANDQEKTQGKEAPLTVYANTPQHVVNLMLELANVKKTDLLYDLGCGDGRIVVTAAKKYGCKALGFDIDPARVRESLDSVKEANLEHLVTIEQKDIFDLDLSKADVVTLFLLPELNVKLIPQLKKMKPGSRVVSYKFDIYGVELDTVVTISSRLHGEHEIYLWTAPLHEMASTAPTSTDRGFHLKAVLTYVATAALGLAAFFWFLRKRGSSRST